jgi:hypothetical protein
MPPNIRYNKYKSTLADILSDRFSDTWKLLSETTIFLSRTKDFDAYEGQLRHWRAKLQSSRNHPETRQIIHGEITELRKNLRFRGYDLSLAKQTIIFDGFRNDASLAEGFRRIVLFLTADDVYYLTGDANHITLSEHLENRLEGTLSGGTPVQKKIKIVSKHYLWYLRRGSTLILSGSDTELKDDFERLQHIAELNPFFLLSRLKNLK